MSDFHLRGELLNAALKGKNGLFSIRKFFYDPLQNMSKSNEVRRSEICQQRRLKKSNCSFHDIRFSRFPDRIDQKKDILADFDRSKKNYFVFKKVKNTFSPVHFALSVNSVCCESVIDAASVKEKM